MNKFVRSMGMFAMGIVLAAMAVGSGCESAVAGTGGGGSSTSTTGGGGADGGSDAGSPCTCAPVVTMVPCVGDPMMTPQAVANFPSMTGVQIAGSVVAVEPSTLVPGAYVAAAGGLAATDGFAIFSCNNGQKEIGFVLLH